MLNMDRFTMPDFSSLSLVTVDVQCDTLDGQPLEIPGTSAILPRLRRLAAAFRERGLPIVHIVRLYAEDGSNADLCRRALVQSGATVLRHGSPGAELAPGLLPHPDVKLDADRLLAGETQPIEPLEWIMYKPRWGAFFQTPLEQHLRQLEVSSIAFAGCNFPNCPRTSLYEASERDFRTLLVKDVVSGIYARGLREIATIGCTVITSSGLVRRIKAVPALRPSVASSAPASAAVRRRQRSAQSE